MVEGAKSGIGVILVEAGRHCAAEALATARSAAEFAPSTPVAVLAAPSLVNAFTGVEVVPAAAVVPDGSVATEILGDKDLLAFAEPFAIEALAAVHGSVLSLAAGTIVAGGFERLGETLAEHPFTLTATSLTPPADANLPALTLRDPGHAVSPSAVACRHGCEAPLRAWQQTMRESLFDPNLQAPHTFRELALVSLLGAPNVAVDGRSTIIAWADWAELMSRDVPVTAPPVVETSELWEILRKSEERVGGDMTETEYRLVDLKIHDAQPLQPLLDIIIGAIAAAGATAEVTPYELLIRDIRRASDPTGNRWPVGATEEFETWLFTADERGVTRIADLYWYTTPAMRERFPDARIAPDGYLSWCRDNGPSQLGFDLLDRAVPPTLPDLGGGEEEPHGLKNALAWRFNVIKGLIPGVAAAGERREQGLDVVAGPGVGDELEQPKRIDVVRRPVLRDRSSRQLSIIGCLRAESGLGQASRASLAALRSLEIPFSYVDTSEKYPSRNAAEAGVDWSTFGAVGDVNLIHANALELLKENDTMFRHRLGGRFNAAMWFWEAGNVPAWYLEAFRRIDELWVASSYLADVLGQFGKVPIHNIGLAAPLPESRTVDRSSFGIEDDEFVFLFVYDALSSHGRKNPDLVMWSFINAFGPRFDGVRLIVKASNLNKLPIDRDRLMEIAAETDAITIIDRYLDHETVYDLMAAADVYVSLHAAEGYGLTILEAMSLGTPAICTGYSGNMDFTTPENSWLVDYQLVRTGEISGPYPKGSIWAKPEFESAVEAMRRAASNRDEMERKAGAAALAAHEAASLERYADKLGEQLKRVL